MGISVVAAEPIGSPPAKPPTTPVVRRSRSRDQVSISILLRQNPHLSLNQLKQIQAQLYHRSLHHDSILIAKLIAACSSSGTMDYAGSLFHSLREPDLVLCNCMLKGYTLNSLPCHAVHFYLQHILSRGFSPDRFTYPYVLKACSSLSDSALGVQIHASLAKAAGLCGDVFMLNSLADMYFKCGKHELASRVFLEIDEPNATSWNVMISGFLSSGNLESAQELFDGMPQRDTVSWNTLLSAFAKAGKMETAQKLFDEMPERNLVSWNGLIAGYSQNGEVSKALLVFSRMLVLGVEPDNTTIVIIVSACSGLETLEHNVIDQIIGCAKLVNSVSVSTALLTLYAKLGRIEDARNVFDRIPEKDLVTWNAMIGGYCQNRCPAEAIELFRLMQKQEFRVKFKPDGVTMVSLIDSCSQLGALALGEWIHAYIEKNKIELDIFLVTALIDMYAKCGDLKRSRLLFSEMSERDLASWNAMIKGLAIHGQANEALKLFNLMERTGLAPNEITFVSLLNACTHGGLVANGIELFELMQGKYGIIPRIEHYGCMVDLLGRAGQVTEAYNFVKRMPVKPDSVVWGALLDSCRSHQKFDLAEEAARELIELEPEHDGNYVLLSNVYATAGKWGDVAKVRAEMKDHQVQKTPGCSTVELEGVVHEFRAGDRSHPESAKIRAVWNELVKQLKLMGYVPDTGALLKDYDEEEDKVESLYGHSEKLALSFALINSKTTMPIRIVKNLRICSDCHRTMELVSRLKEREIIVRDRNRFHHFSAGSCSCGGYW